MTTRATSDMKTSIHPRCLIQESARRIRELHARVHETHRQRNKDSEAQKDWTQACSVFHRAYDGLAFPGGWEAALKRLKTGESRDVEAALAFLEVRPYFFRSQYIWKKLSRLLKHVPLTKAQQERYVQVRKDEKFRKEERLSKR